MSDTPRTITISPSKHIWREYDIDVSIEINPGNRNVVNISHEEAVTLRDKLTQYLERN